MKTKIYLGYGILIIALFMTANLRGFTVTGMAGPAKWGPQGHSMSHK